MMTENTKHDWVADADALDEVDAAESDYRTRLLNAAFIAASLSQSEDQHGNTLITKAHVREARVIMSPKVCGREHVTDGGTCTTCRGGRSEASKAPQPVPSP